MPAFDEILWTDPWQTGAGRAGIQVLAGGINADSTSMILTWRCWGMNSPSADSYVWYGLYSYAAGGGAEWPANSNMTRIVAPAGSGSQSWVAAEWHFTVPVSFGNPTVLDVYAGCQNSSNWGSEAYASCSGRITIPARPYHAPAQPGVWITDKAVFCNGHQLNPYADSYWSETWWALETNDVWGPGVQQTNATTQRAYAAEPNSRYRGGVASANGTGGGSGTAVSGYYYTAPNTPAGLQAVRANGSSSVQLSWNSNGSRYVEHYRLYRSLNGGAWSLLTTTSSPGYLDTLALGSTASYYVEAVTPAGVNQAVSAASAQVAVSGGYNLPNPPTVALVRNGATSAYLTVSGNQTNPNADRFTQTVKWQLLVNNVAVGGGTVGGASTGIPINGLPSDAQIKALVNFSNSSGDSTGVLTNELYTTPDAPTAFTAARTGIGSTTVQLNWINNAGYPANYLLEKSTDAGGTWSQVAIFAGSAVAATVTQATNEAALYRLRVVTSDGQYSAYAAAQNEVGVTYVSNKAGLRLGGTPVDHCFVGSQRIRRICKGSTVMWEDGDA